MSSSSDSEGQTSAPRRRVEQHLAAVTAAAGGPVYVGSSHGPSQGPRPPAWQVSVQPAPHLPPMYHLPPPPGPPPPGAAWPGHPPLQYLVHPLHGGYPGMAHPPPHPPHPPPHPHPHPATLPQQQQQAGYGDAWHAFHSIWRSEPDSPTTSRLGRGSRPMRALRRDPPQQQAPPRANPRRPAPAAGPGSDRWEALMAASRMRRSLTGEDAGGVQQPRARITPGASLPSSLPTAAAAAAAATAAAAPPLSAAQLSYVDAHLPLVNPFWAAAKACSPEQRAAHGVLAAAFLAPPSSGSGGGAGRVPGVMVNVALTPPQVAAVKAGQAQVQAWCLQVGDVVPHRCHWPQAALLALAGQRQGAVYRAKPLKATQADQPADCSAVARIRPSFDVALSGTTAGTQGHLLLVRLVSRVSEEEVAASLPPPLPLAQALEALKQQLSGDDDGLVVEVTRVSLLCPLSFSRMAHPMHFSHVPGLVAFDRDTFLSSVGRSGRWQCPVSMSLGCVTRLVPHVVLGEVLRVLDEAGLKGVTEVEVRADGCWRPSGVAEPDTWFDLLRPDTPRLAACLGHTAAAGGGGTGAAGGGAGGGAAGCGGATSIISCGSDSDEEGAGGQQQQAGGKASGPAAAQAQRQQQHQQQQGQGRGAKRPADGPVDLTLSDDDEEEQGPGAAAMIPSRRIRLIPSNAFSAQRAAAQQQQQRQLPASRGLPGLREGSGEHTPPGAGGRPWPDVLERAAARLRAAGVGRMRRLGSKEPPQAAGGRAAATGAAAAVAGAAPGAAGGGGRRGAGRGPLPGLDPDEALLAGLGEDTASGSNAPSSSSSDPEDLGELVAAAAAGASGRARPTAAQLFRRWWDEDGPLEGRPRPRRKPLLQDSEEEEAMSGPPERERGGGRSGRDAAADEEHGSSGEQQQQQQQEQQPLKRLRRAAPRGAGSEPPAGGEPPSATSSQGEAPPPASPLLATSPVRSRGRPVGRGSSLARQAAPDTAQGQDTAAGAAAGDEGGAAGSGGDAEPVHEPGLGRKFKITLRRPPAAGGRQPSPPPPAAVAAAAAGEGAGASGAGPEQAGPPAGRGRKIKIKLGRVPVATEGQPPSTEQQQQQQPQQAGAPADVIDLMDSD